MLLLYINLDDRNPTYPALAFNIPSGMVQDNGFTFFNAGVLAKSSLRKQAWRNPKEGRVGCLHQSD